MFPYFRTASPSDVYRMNQGQAADLMEVIEAERAQGPENLARWVAFDCPAKVRNTLKVLGVINREGQFFTNHPALETVRVISAFLEQRGPLTMDQWDDVSSSLLMKAHLVRTSVVIFDQPGVGPVRLNFNNAAVQMVVSRLKLAA